MTPAPPIQRRKVEVTLSYDKQQLAEVVKILTREKKTGALTLHYGQGSVAAVEWKEQQKA